MLAHLCLVLCWPSLLTRHSEHTPPPPPENGCVVFPAVRSAAAGGGSPSALANATPPTWVTDQWLEAVGPVESVVIDADSVPVPSQHASTVVLAGNPQPFSTAHPRMVIVDPSTAESIGLQQGWLSTSPTAVEVFSERARFCGTTAFHHNYGGHQFGSWAGQLGDGRAVSLGILQGRPPPTTPDEAHALPHPPPLEIAVKGGGRTPFSRRGDGRAVLQSNLREFLASATLLSLGVPTTRALCVVASDVEYDGLIRDIDYQGRMEQVPAGTLTRVSPSFVRFGTVQIVSRRQGPAGLARLARATLRVLRSMEAAGDPASAKISLDQTHAGVQPVCFYTAGPPSCAANADTFTDLQLLECLLERVTARTAALIAAWMAVGFAHGVMNTDNLSLLGITIDLNVFGFVNDYDVTFAPNLIDDEDRYAFGRQKDIGWWNLHRLKDALTGTPYVNDYRNEPSWDASKSSTSWLADSSADTILARYNTTYDMCFEARMRLRLGLHTHYSSQQLERSSVWLVKAWVKWLTVAAPDYHHASLMLGDVASLLAPPTNDTDYSAGIQLLSSTATRNPPRSRRWLGKILSVLHSVVHRGPPLACAALPATSARAGCAATTWRRAVYRAVPVHVLRTAQTKVITEQTAQHGQDAFVAAAFRAVSQPFESPRPHRQQAIAKVATTADLPPPPQHAAASTKDVSAWVSKALSCVPERAAAKMKTSCGGQ